MTGARGWLRALAIAATGAACDARAPAAGEGPLDAIAPLSGPADPRGDDSSGLLAVLTPRSSADVLAPYTSPSTHLAVRLGDRIAQGEVVARLDDRQLREELDAARAQLRTAEAAIRQAQVDKDSAEIILARETTAEAAGVSSHADAVSARQAVEKAAAAITVARATADERTTRIAQLQGHLVEMTLTAPIAGRVAMIYPQDGARVEQGRPVLRIISGGVFVKFAIPADQAGAPEPGDTVDVRVERRADRLTATVAHVSPEVDAVAQMRIADAELVNPPSDLQPGTVCRILLRAQPRPRR
ncbi:MAG TPA: HlyD family efflux transporter periplasmic adaptor subunit [Kofleriaceae bacterium]|nr:HlyD family efflux transporter periplasmic adaptor subunit [Kofleriaceae bacterium]